MNRPMEPTNRLRVIPVFDRDGQLLLFDRYLDGRWIGSRRTRDQAIAGFSPMMLPSARRDVPTEESGQ